MFVTFPDIYKLATENYWKEIFEMKRIILAFLSLVLLCAAFTASAEANEPLYATVGDALAAAGEFPIAGGEDDYYAVVTEVNGKYYRSVAETDDRYRELQQAVWEAQPEQMV